MQSIKVLLKRSNTLNYLNTQIKSYLQEKKANRSLAYYRTEAAKRGLSPPHGSELKTALRQRLAARGIHPVPKPKGNLHIFLAYPLNNWESVLPLALAPFGRVTTFEWRSLGYDDQSAKWLKERDSMNETMLEGFFKANAKKEVDIVVGYLSGYTTDPNILQKMGEAGAVIFNFCLDDKLSFRGRMVGGRWAGPAALASVVDLNLTNSPDSVIKYMVEGGLAMFWPEAAHPEIHRPYDVPFEFDVSFVGQKYGWRPKFIAKLQKMGIKVTCFGNGWENGPLSNEEMVKLYSRSRINLGFAGVGHSKKLMCLKGRDFEVPMSGGLYLTQDNPELSLVYNVGKEIVTYRNEKDCVEKIKWLLKSPDEADKIRKAGRMRALKDHTWDKRFSDVFKIAGLLRDDKV
jgi:hypothetical protein